MANGDPASGPDTVPEVMDDVHESDQQADVAAAPGTEAGDPRSRPRPRGGAETVLGLPWRTWAVCLCIATIGALVAGLIASTVLSEDDDEATPGLDLESVDEADPEAMLAVGLTTTDGKPTTVAAHLDGRPVVVNLWAWSCVPCIDELPLLEAAHREHDDVAFLGIHINDRSNADQLARATRLADQTGITFPWVQDAEQDFFFAANAAGMPTTLFLDQRGRIMATKTGAFANQGELQAWIDAHRPEP